MLFLCSIKSLFGVCVCVCVRVVFWECYWNSGETVDSKSRKRERWATRQTIPIQSISKIKLYIYMNYHQTIYRVPCGLVIPRTSYPRPSDPRLRRPSRPARWCTGCTRPSCRRPAGRLSSPPAFSTSSPLSSSLACSTAWWAGLWLQQVHDAQKRHFLLKKCNFPWLL